MKRFLSGVGIVALLGSSLLFASLNSSQRVTVRLGFATVYGVPLTAVAFGSVIAGMVVMLVAGIRSDLKVRRILRARLEEEVREERDRFVDHSQQDLFDSLPPVAASPVRPEIATSTEPRDEVGSSTMSTTRDRAETPSGRPEPLMTPHRLSDDPRPQAEAAARGPEPDGVGTPPVGEQTPHGEQVPEEETTPTDWRGLDASP